MSWKFSHGYHVWRLLQLEHLLVNELALVVHDDVGIEGTFIFERDVNGDTNGEGRSEQSSPKQC